MYINYYSKSMIRVNLKKQQQCKCCFLREYVYKRSICVNLPNIVFSFALSTLEAIAPFSWNLHCLSLVKYFPQSKSVEKNSKTPSRQWGRSASNEEAEAVRQTAVRSVVMPLPYICFSLWCDVSKRPPLFPWLTFWKEDWRRSQLRACDESQWA